MDSRSGVRILEDSSPFAEGGGRAHFGTSSCSEWVPATVLPDEVQYGEGSVGVSLPYGYVRRAPTCCRKTESRSKRASRRCSARYAARVTGTRRRHRMGVRPAAARLFQAYGPITNAVSWSLRARVLAPLAQRGFSVEENDSAEAFEPSRARCDLQRRAWRRALSVHAARTNAESEPPLLAFESVYREYSRWFGARFGASAFPT